MTIFTIGLVRRTAEDFFTALRDAGVRHLIDVRLRNSSQLAGFSKARDLEFFLHELLGATYEHRRDLAPTSELLDGYRAGDLGWEEYAAGFRHLVADRRSLDTLGDDDLARPTALLCSEASPERCHRRLLAEDLAQAWGAEVRHL